MALAAVVLTGGSFAWACSQQPRASMEGGRTSGPVGALVGVTGSDFGAGPVEVRWNSMTGFKLGDATGPSFSVSVRIPQAPVGVHYIVATQTLGSASSSVAFEVTEAPQSTAPTSGTTSQTGRTSTAASGADEESGATGSTATGSTGTGTGSTGSSSTGSTGTGSTDSGRIESSPAAVTNAPPVETKAGEAKESGAVAPVAAPTNSGVTAAQPATARAASANPAALTTASGQVVFGGSEAEAPSVAEPGVVSAAAGTVSGDTWSGFASATKPSLMLDSDTAAAPNSQGSVPALGVALLGSGLVAMFAGFAMAELRRKRAFAQTGSR
ncbi:MAG TPA: hypothetical protein VM142_15375 [Acidimicrobiales bacterium]|nr:hypothetical protein [Acidimicrobiales bacterium]